jgi:spore coat polysaccharide biosynthesis protein SpsF (cytidylyltransferase family)
MNVLCVVQARTGSTRLPGKVLQDLGGRPMLRFMLDRLRDLDGIEVVVATSTLGRDDAIVDVARGAKCRTVRGPERDVLGRYALALDETPSDHVIRLTADCPLMDPALVSQVLDAHLAAAADYTSNVFPRSFPKGLDVEVVRASVLKAAADEARDPAEREHVMPFVYRQPERFRLANVRNEEWLGAERWTVDTIEDLEFVRELVATMGSRTFRWTDALAKIGRKHEAPTGALVLVPAAAEHSDFYLACRADPDAVKWTLSGRAIDPTEHACWYTIAIDDPGRRMRVGVIDGAAVGTARVDVRNGIGEVGITLAPEYRGRGLSVPLLNALVADCAGDPQVVTLIARVHAENMPSLRAFLATGFAPHRADVAEPRTAPRGSQSEGGQDGFRVLSRPVRPPI